MNIRVFKILCLIFLTSLYAQTSKQLYEKALQLGEQEKYTEAIPLLQKSTTHKKCPLEVFYIAMQYSFQAKQYDQTIQFSIQGLERYPNEIDFLYYQAQAHFQLQQYKEAQIPLQKILQLYPDNVHVLYMLAQTHQQLQQNTEALAYYQKTIPETKCYTR